MVDCIPNVFGIIGAKIGTFYEGKKDHTFVQLHHLEIDVKDLPESQPGLIIWSRCQESDLAFAVVVPINIENDEMTLGEASVYDSNHFDVPDLEIHE